MSEHNKRSKALRRRAGEAKRRNGNGVAKATPQLEAPEGGKKLLPKRLRKALAAQGIAAINHAAIDEAFRVLTETLLAAAQEGSPVFISERAADKLRAALAALERAKEKES